SPAVCLPGRLPVALATVLPWAEKAPDQDEHEDCHAVHRHQYVHAGVGLAAKYHLQCPSTDARRPASVGVQLAGNLDDPVSWRAPRVPSAGLSSQIVPLPIPPAQPVVWPDYPFTTAPTAQVADR